MKAKSLRSKAIGRSKRGKVGARPRQSSKSRMAKPTGWECSITIIQSDGRRTRRIEAAARSMIPQRKASARANDWAARVARKLVRGVNTPATASLLASLGNSDRLAIVHRLLQGPATYQELQRTTKLKAGPLYHHIGSLRLANVVGPKSRDTYELTESGRRLALLTVVIPKLLRCGVKRHSRSRTR